MAKKKNRPIVCCTLVRIPEIVNSSGLKASSRMMAVALSSCSGLSPGATTWDIKGRANKMITSATKPIMMARKFISEADNSQALLRPIRCSRSDSTGMKATPKAPAAKVKKKKSGMVKAAK